MGEYFESRNEIEPFQGNGDMTKTFSTSVDGLYIQNMGGDSLTFTVGSQKFTVTAGGEFDDMIDSFTTVTIQANGPFRGWGRQSGVAKQIGNLSKNRVYVSSYQNLVSNLGQSNEDWQPAITQALSDAYAQGKGIVEFPIGTLQTSPFKVTYFNMELVGSGSAYGYDSSLTVPKTTLKFTSGTIGIDFGNSSASDNAQYCKIKGIKIDGNDILDYGVRTAGANLFEEMYVTKCNQGGVLLDDATNSTHFNLCSFVRNTGDGLRSTGVSSTVFSLKQCTIRGNRKGIYLESGAEASIENTVIESNIDSAIDFYRASGSNLLFNIKFDTCWIENNGSATAPTLVSNSSSPSTANISRVKFENCYFGVNANQTHMNLTASNYWEFDTCEFYTDPSNTSVVFVFASTATNIHFKNCDGVTVANNGTTMTIATGAIVIQSNGYLRNRGSSLTFSSIPANSTAELTVSLTGAKVGNNAYCSPVNDVGAGLMWCCYIMTNDQVTIRLANVTTSAITPLARTWYVDMLQR